MKYRDRITRLGDTGTGGSYDKLWHRAV